MTVKKKILISAITVVAVFLVLPVLVLNLAKAEQGLPLILILFFVINPITEIFISIIAGTNLSKLWWISVLAPLYFPLFFSLATLDLVLDLFVYSAVYLAIGITTMLIVFFIKKAKK